MTGFGHKRSQLDREILRLAVPALGALAADPLVSLIDTAYVGRIGTVALGALGVAVAISSVAFFLFSFLAYGTTPLVAGALGESDLERAGRLTVAALALGAIVGIAATVTIEIFAVPVLRAMGAEQALLSGALAYLRIRVLGLPALAIITVGHGVFRGHQDTRTPLKIAASVAVLNLIVDPVFIFGFGWGLAGAAWATMAAQWIGAFWFLGLFGAERTRLALSWAWPGGASFRSLLGAARALLIRSGSLLAGFTLATAVVTRLGDSTIAAHQVAIQLWIFLALVVDALAIAAQALVGKYFATERGLAAAYSRRLLAWGLGSGAALAVIMALGRTVLPRLFSSDPLVISTVGAVYGFVVVMQPLNAVVFVWDGILIGASRFGYLAGTTVLSVLATVAVLAAVPGRGWGLRGVWWAIVVMMLVRLVAVAGWHLAGPLGSGRGRFPGSREDEAPAALR